MTKSEIKALIVNKIIEIAQDATLNAESKTAMIGFYLEDYAKMEAIDHSFAVAAAGQRR